jgi:hypothetical protein
MQGEPSDQIRKDRTAAGGSGLQRLLGRFLAQAGDVRGLLWQPARRFSGLGPRWDRKGGRGPVFRCGLKWKFVNSNFLSFSFDNFSEAFICILVCFVISIQI